MISICKRVRLQQLRKAKYSILGVNLMIFLYLASNLNTFFKKCNFLEKFILSFFFEQDLTDDSSLSSGSCSNVTVILEPIQKTIELINDGNISQFERKKAL